MNKSSASVTVGPKRKSSSPACCCRNSSLSPVIRLITDRGSGILAVRSSSRLMPRYDSILGAPLQRPVSKSVGSIRKRMLQEIKHDSRGLPRRPRQAGLKVPKERQITVPGTFEHIATAARPGAPERVMQHQG